MCALILLFLSFSLAGRLKRAKEYVRQNWTDGQLSNNGHMPQAHCARAEFNEMDTVSFLPMENPQKMEHKK